ncbi:MULTISPECIES: hypothetical protein [Methylorubrum]|jgi:hypothetical protein|uniref:Uncharacterized protein n=2 Tax=Methylorubrum extorquens TaxID=408 RepID=C5ARA5_METEA|nr:MULTISPECIES: hypothetical protein [Methylorubrum]ACS40214.1 hypothetical protein; putative exported protein [Methylorubrum extorquens AM1]EHP93822.1 hypothetical protein MetexDRAFT_1329 [Methylorubrum extorquens DSM 13060]MCP1541636.1 hypothetical protein [Methylorubrum extorquens]MCP1585827.1 hypothetical protein [Methylorubrum extorquens]BDL39825.1 hypothetical protein MSPGM_24150 [Methylorubrum sp. GM97]
MTHRTKITVALALALGLAATPSFAQGVASDSASYNRDGTLNVWGAHIDPVRERGGLLGGVGNVVGGTLGAAGNIVGGTVDAAGNVVGGVVGGTANAADSIVTGSVRRPAGYSAYGAQPVDRAGAYGRAAY